MGVNLDGAKVAFVILWNFQQGCYCSVNFTRGPGELDLAASRKELHVAMHYGDQGESVCSINKISLRTAQQGWRVSVKAYLKTPPTHHLAIVNHTRWLQMIIHGLMANNVSDAMRPAQAVECA